MNIIPFKLSHTKMRKLMRKQVHFKRAQISCLGFSPPLLRRLSGGMWITAAPARLLLLDGCTIRCC